MCFAGTSQLLHPNDNPQLQVSASVTSAPGSRSSPLASGHHGNKHLSKAASASSAETLLKVSHGPPVLRALSEPGVKDMAVVTAVPKVDVLAAVTTTAAGRHSPLDRDTGVTVVTAAAQTAAGSSDCGVSMLLSSGGEEKMAVTSMVMSVPVVLAQPVFVNCQTPSGLHHTPSAPHLPSSLQPAHLGAVLIESGHLTLPEIPLSSLLKPSLPHCMPLTPTSLVTAPGHLPSLFLSGRISPSTPSMFSRSPCGAFDKGMLERSASSDRTKDSSMAGEFGDQRSSDFKDGKLTRALSAESGVNRHGLKRSPEGKDLPPVVPMKIPLYLCGHAYPSLHSATFVTFLSAKRPQPNYVQVKGNNRRVSMYSNWRLSTHNPNPVGLTPRMLLALYR